MAMITNHWKLLKRPNWHMIQESHLLSSPRLFRHLHLVFSHCYQWAKKISNKLNLWVVHTHLSQALYKAFCLIVLLWTPTKGKKAALKARPYASMHLSWMKCKGRWHFNVQITYHSPHSEVIWYPFQTAFYSHFSRPSKMFHLYYDSEQERD